MEFYTTSISERTRLRRAVYEDTLNQRRKRSKPSASAQELNEVNIHSPRKDYGQGSQGASISTKRASGKGSKKVVSSSNKDSEAEDNVMDVEEFWRQETLAKPRRNTRLNEVKEHSSSTKGAFLNGSNKAISSSNKDSEPEENEVIDVEEFWRQETLAKARHKTGKGGCGSGRKLSGRGSKRVPDSRSQLRRADEEESEANGISYDSDDKDVQEIDENEFMRLASRSNCNAASSSKQNTPHSFARNGGSHNGTDLMDYDVENSSFSVSSESRSTDAEGTDDSGDMVGSFDDFDELSSSSESESDDDSDDEDFVVEKDSPSITMVGTSSEDESEELISEKDSDVSEDESGDKQALKRKKSAFPIKKKINKYDSEKKGHVSRNKSSLEEGRCDEHALKRKEGLGRKSEKPLVSSSQIDYMHKNRSFCDFDGEASNLNALSNSEIESTKPTSICKLRARRECSLQTGQFSLKREKKLGFKEETDVELTEGSNEIIEPKDSLNTGGGEEKDETLGLTKRKQNSGTKDEVLGALLKDLLEKEETNEVVAEESEAKSPSPVKESIPLKFRFEDEDEYPQVEEKSDFELMVEGLFEEMYYAQQQIYEVGSSGPPTAEIEEEDDGEEVVNCSKGKHGKLYFDEEIGLRCSCCKDIILESKYVLPDLVTPTSETSRTRNLCREEFLKFDNLVLDASKDNFQGSCNYSSGTVWDTIPGVQEQMYPHQQEGFEFLWTNLAGTISLPKLNNSDLSGGGGCIISHAPGTGKTKLTIVFLETLLKLFPNCRPIIIAPVSILLTWEEEFKKWKTKFPFYNLNDLAVSSDENLCNNKDLVRVMKMHAWKKGRSILGVSYNLFEKLAGEKFTREKGKKKREKVAVGENFEMLRSILLEMPGLVVLDEGHTARNERSSIWNALTNLKTKKCIILSGTPFQNNFRELFNTLSLVRPEIAAELAKERTFADGIQPRVGKRYNKENYSLTSHKLDEAIGKLKATIAPFVHVHKGSILQKSLPGLTDCVVILSPAPLQKNLIEAIQNLQRQNTFEFEHKVAMVSVHPSLILHCGNLSEKEKSSFDQAELEKLRTDYDRGVKTRFVMELIRLSVALSEKVLIFSQYVQPLEMIMDHLKTVFDWCDGKQVYRIRGKLDQKQRQKMINAYNDPNSEAKVMLASIKCCSEGIHLVGASRVILLDVVWNPSVERQAICRAYRLGQKKVVYTYHLMTSGTTEAEKYCRQSQKDRISELVFSAPSSVTTEDPVVHLDDKVLEDMVGQTRLKDMFNKIIYQPKDTNLIESFGSESL